MSKNNLIEVHGIFRRLFAVAILAFIVISSFIIAANVTNECDEPKQEPVEEFMVDELPYNIKMEIYCDNVSNVFYLVDEMHPDPYYLQYDVPLDDETLELLANACEITGVQFELALAVIWKETRFQNVMGDHGSSYGYMQIQLKWHKGRMDRLGVTDLNDPYGNFLVGCDLLAELLEKYDLSDALTCYNTGSPGESKYARDVINYMENLLTEQN